MGRIMFAYGSNMCTRRLRERAPSARKLGIGRLPKHWLLFHKRGADGSGKANVSPSLDPHDSVFGVLFELPDLEMRTLDRVEGGYLRIQVQVVSMDGALVPGETFVARPEMIHEELRPFDWYLELLRAGAAEHGLPFCYVEFLNRTAGVPDSNRRRRAKHFALAGTGMRSRVRTALRRPISAPVSDRCLRFHE